LNIKRILLTGGRAPSTLHLSRFFHSKGYEVISAECTVHHLLKHSSSILRNYVIPSPNSDIDGFISSLLSIISNENIDLFIPTCEEVFHVSMHLEKFEGKCKVFTDSIDKMNLLHNKHSFNLFIVPFTNSVPKTFRIRTIDELIERSNEFHSFVLKPVYSRFSSQVHFLKKGTQLPKISFSEEQEWVIQEYIEGTQYCSYATVHNGRLLSFSLYKTVYSAGVGATIHFKHYFNEDIYLWVRKIAEQLAFNGQLSFDFIVDGDANFYPIECNPRLTSGIHLIENPSFWMEDQPCVFPIGKQTWSLKLAMLLYAQQNIKRNGNPYRLIKEFLQSKDVIFSLYDWKPFFYQFYVYFKLYYQSKKSKISILEITTHDIEWNG